MVSCRQAGPELLLALIGFVICLLHGEINPDVSSVLFGGNLIVFEKNNRGDHPIAVGHTRYVASPPNVPTHTPPVN